jgi:hypothetical protein
VPVRQIRDKIGANGRSALADQRQHPEAAFLGQIRPRSNIP